MGKKARTRREAELKAKVYAAESRLPTTPAYPPVTGKLDLAPIKARLLAADPGPWEADDYGMYVFRKPGIGMVTDSGDEEEKEIYGGRLAVEAFREDVLNMVARTLATIENHQAASTEDLLGFVQSSIGHLAKNASELEVHMPQPIVRMRGAGRCAPQEANNEFIAEARQDIPALIAEVESHRKEITRLHDAVTIHKDFIQRMFEVSGITQDFVDDHGEDGVLRTLATRHPNHEVDHE